MNTVKANPAYSSRTEPTQTACYAVHGVADPGLLPRVVGLWAKRGLTPSRWHSALYGPNNAEVYIDVEVPGMNTALAHQVANELRQLWGVSQVLMTLDRDSAAA